MQSLANVQEKLAEADLKRRKKLEERKRKATYMLQRALMVNYKIQMHGNDFDTGCSLLMS